jgi:hypothetical protein
MQDTAEYNMFLQNNSLSRIEADNGSDGESNATPNTDIANNSALFNYLEKQYQNDRDLTSPELVRLNRNLLRSAAEHQPISLTL